MDDVSPILSSLGFVTSWKNISPHLLQRIEYLGSISAWHSPSGGYTKAQSFALTVMQVFRSTAYPVIPLWLRMHPSEDCSQFTLPRGISGAWLLVFSAQDDFQFWGEGIGSLLIQGQPLWIILP